MNIKRPLPIRKKAWCVFSVVLFGLAWLLWVPVQSKPLFYFWELWPMLFTSAALRVEFWLFFLGGIFGFAVGAVFLGWVLQFAWGLVITDVLKRPDRTA